MAINDRPKCCDYYAILHLEATATSIEIQRTLDEFEDKLGDNDKWEYTGELYSKTEFKAKIQEARIILPDAERRARYDGIHSGIEIVWDAYTRGLGGSHNNSSSMDTILYERTVNKILACPTAPQPRNPPNRGIHNKTFTLVSKGKEGCNTCIEETKSANRIYRYCGECGYSMHGPCWTKWIVACIKGKNAITCPVCRRRLVSDD